MGEKWICSNCGAENSLKFCTKCGTPRPEAEPVPAAAEDTWECPCGTTGNTGNFCKHCGTPRNQAVVKAAEEAAETVEEVIAEPAEEAVETVKEAIAEPAEEAAEAVEEVIAEPVEEAAEAVEEVIAEPVEEAAETVEEVIAEPVEEAAEAVEEVIAEPAEEAVEAVEDIAEEPAVEAGASIGAAAVAAGAVIEEAIPEVVIPENDIAEAEVSEMEIPEVGAPEVAIPEVELPDVEIPETAEPEIELPEMEIPESEVSDLELPEDEMPEAEMPEADVPTFKKADDDTWNCTCGAFGNKGNFCNQCGLPKEQGRVIPEEIIPEVEAIDDGSWTCSCGFSGNKGNFCRQCGLPKEQGMVPAARIVEETQEEIPPASPLPAPESGPWDCPCGKKGNEGAFCRNCGTPRAQGFAPVGTPVEAAKAAFTQDAPGLKGPEVPQTQEKKTKRVSMKLLIILIAAAVVIAAAIVCAVIFLSPKKYTVNQKPQNEVLTVMDEYSLLVDKERDISFQYPSDLLADRGEDGDYIFGGEKGTEPYVLVNRVNETTKPKDYFKKYQESMEQQYEDMDFSDIFEVEVEGKTLYMIQTYVPYGGPNVDQYLELYDDCYITYTAEGYDSSAENRELYYAIASLRTSADAYPVPQALIYENDLGNFSVEVMPDYTVQEFAGGLYAEKGNAGQFVTYMNTDTVGALIYNMDDFLERADMMSEYVESIIGVNAVEITGDSSTEIYNGKSFLVFPVKMELRNGSEAVGKLCIADCDNSFGCYIMCYYLEKNSGSLQEEEGENFLASMSVHGDPNIREFLVKDLSSLGYGKIAVRADLVGSIDLNEEKDIVEIKNPDDTQKIVIEYLEGNSLYDDIASKIAQDLADKYKTSNLTEIQPPEDGRYYMNACEITYKDDKDVNRVYRIYCVDSTSDHKFCIDYDVEEGKDDWAKEVCDYLFWSWKLK